MLAPAVNEAQQPVLAPTQVEATSIQGSRIIDMHSLNVGIQEVTKHSASCGGICTIEEASRAGLASRFTLVCTKCNTMFTMASSDKVETAEGYRWSVNLLAVLGTMTTGGGAAQLTSWLATMGIPSMTKATFSATERLIGDAMKRSLTEKMIDAGNVER